MSSSQFSMKKEYLLEIYDRNPFVQFLEMKIADLKEGYSELIMPVDTEKHTNLYNLAHGGALASLADTAMGIACATIGNKVVTLDMNMNFIKGAKPQMGLKGVGKVIHTGRTTMVAEADIIDEDGNLILKARGTFLVIGKFE